MEKIKVPQKGKIGTRPFKKEPQKSGGLDWVLPTLALALLVSTVTTDNGWRIVLLAGYATFVAWVLLFWVAPKIAKILSRKEKAPEDRLGLLLFRLIVPVLSSVFFILVVYMLATPDKTLL